MIELKEIKVKLDTIIYDMAKEYNVNIDDTVNSALIKKVNEIKYRIAEEKALREYLEYSNEQKLIKIIKRISKKESKFNYASLDSIVAEAEIELMSRKETIDILNRLEKNNVIYKPAKSNYRISKVKKDKGS